MMLASASLQPVNISMGEIKHVLFKMHNERSLSKAASEFLLRNNRHCDIFILKVVGLGRVKWNCLHD